MVKNNNSIVKGKHDPYWDNVKFFLILLVVIGHFCEGFFDNSSVLTVIWEEIYSFHMPAFILVSGMFLSKTINQEPFRCDKIVAYLIFYVFISITYRLMCKYCFHWKVSFDIFVAAGPQWYMLAIAVFIGLTHLVKDIKPSVVLSVSLVFSIIAGYDDSINDYFAISRLIVSYPFFYTGYYFGYKKLKEYIYALKKHKYMFVLSGCWFVLTISLIAKFLPHYLKISGLCTMKNPYCALGIPLQLGGPARVLFYCFTISMIISFLVIVPTERYFYTEIGSRTMQIYILHGYVIRFLMFICYDSIIKSYVGSIWPLFIIISRIACTFIFSPRFMEKPFRSVMNIKIDVFYKSK